MRAPILPPALRAEVARRHAAGASHAALVRWLREEHRIRITRATVARTVWSEAAAARARRLAELADTIASRYPHDPAAAELRALVRAAATTTAPPEDR